MKILHVVRNLEIGGMERVVLLLAEAQVAAGHHVTVAELERATGKTYPLPDGVSHLQGQTALWWSVCTSKAAVIHAHNLVALRSCWLMVKLRRMRLVFTKHGMNFPGGYCHWLMQRPDAFVAVSKLIADRYLERFPKKQNTLHFIPNGINTSVDLPDRDQARSKLQIDPNTRVFLWVGRMVHEKGLDILIAAWQQATLPHVMLLLVGDGPKREALEKQAGDLVHTIRFEGAQEGLASYYATADVFVMPSRTEGLPMALLEAGVAGMPAIVSNVGAMPGMIETAEGGWIVQPEDVNTLVEVLFEVLQLSKPELQERGKLLQDHVRKHHSMTAMADAYEKVYCGG